MKAIQISKYGGPDVLELIDMEKPVPAPDEVLIEIHASGVNYADTARREGQYVVPTPLPFIPGAETAGIISEAGASVSSDLKPGTRVVCLVDSGGYSEYVRVHAASVIPIPDDMDYQTAASIPLQGLSAYHILKTMGRVQKGETVLIHAAAGGVGLLAVQLAKIFGAGKVIATASSPEKLKLAEDMGADVLIDYTAEGWEERVLEAAEKGVDVALEMAGGSVFKKTLRCLAPFGRIIVYGNASGEQYKMNPQILMRRNQSVMGFFLPQIMKKPELLQSSINELFAYVNDGRLKLSIGGVYPLDQAAKVHKDLQSRLTKGKLILSIK
ncbi:NADPH2:quinone reductase [Bacillus sp. OV322]|uniref:quinone oxidoreductase family protein n=1 Tax=Bacillus sp. OV322 TaxID=1882764 RepID=UPI0008E206E6|nr:quinone oxidoreductase [Bacillus sp. OV322]SFC02401.1 NADPH2:quinone reductase [Bacillus sp. OV322]